MTKQSRGEKAQLLGQVMMLSIAYCSKLSMDQFTLRSMMAIFPVAFVGLLSL